MADIKKINIKGTDYNIVDASAVHTVDSALSSSSENPVQNKVVTNALAQRLFVYTLGTAPTITSTQSPKIDFTYQSSDAINIASAWTANTEFAVSTTMTINGKSESIIATKSRAATISSTTYYLFNGVLSNGNDDN